MKKLLFILMIVLAFVIACPAFGQQVGVSWTQQYRLWGFEVYDEQYVHPGITSEIAGLELSAISHIREDEDWEYWDTAVGYKLPFGGLYIQPGYGYLHLPGELDVQEISITAGIAGEISPRITVSHIVPENTDEGQVYTAGIDLNIGDPNNIIAGCLYAEATYNDGVNPLGVADISDITHLTAGLQLKIPMESFTILPAVIYQHSFEPELLGTDRNEIWAAVSIVRKF